MEKHLYKQGLRKCGTCKKLLKLNFDNFYRDKNQGQGFTYECKDCHKKRKKEREKTPRGIILKKESAKRHYLKYRERIKEKTRQYRKFNRQKIREHRLNTRIDNGKRMTKRVIKRKYPQNNQCELCLKIVKRLAYHHWDDNDLKEGSFVKGIWVCWFCHYIIEFLDKKNNLNKLVKRYFNLKEKINKIVDKSSRVSPS